MSSWNNSTLHLLQLLPSSAIYVMVIWPFLFIFGLMIQSLIGWIPQHFVIPFFIMWINCAIWEECRIRVFANKILRRIFQPKGNANGEWRRLHNEELHSLYRSPYIIRVIKSRRLIWARHVARMEKGRSAFKILTGVFLAVFLNTWISVLSIFCL